MEKATAEVATHADAVRRLEARRESLVRDASDALRVAAAAEARLAATDHDRKLAVDAASAAANERSAASRALVARVAGPSRGRRGGARERGGDRARAERCAMAAADDSRRKSARLPKPPSANREGSDREEARERAEKARREREAAVAEARRRVERARAAAADEARAVAEYEEEAAKERGRVGKMRARELAASEGGAGGVRRSRAKGGRFGRFGRASTRGGERLVRLTPRRLTRKGAASASGEPRRGAKWSRPASTKSPRMKRTGDAAIRIDAAEREAEDRLLAAKRTAQGRSACASPL